MNCAKVLFLKPPQKTMKRMAKCLTAEAADEARAVKRERQRKQRQQQKRAQEKALAGDAGGLEKRLKTR